MSQDVRRCSFIWCKIDSFFSDSLSRVSMLHSPSVRSWFSRALPKHLQEMSRDMVNVRIWVFLILTFLHLIISKAEKEVIRSALDGTPVENNCPVKDEAFVACCDSREPSSKAEDSTTKSSSLMLGLCSTSKYVKNLSSIFHL